MPSSRCRHAPLCGEKPGRRRRHCVIPRAWVREGAPNTRHLAEKVVLEDTSRRRPRAGGANGFHDGPSVLGEAAVAPGPRTTRPGDGGACGRTVGSPPGVRQVSAQQRARSPNESVPDNPRPTQPHLARAGKSLQVSRSPGFEARAGMLPQATPGHSSRTAVGTLAGGAAPQWTLLTWRPPWRAPPGCSAGGQHPTSASLNSRISTSSAVRAPEKRDFCNYLWPERCLPFVAVPTALAHLENALQPSPQPPATKQLTPPASCATTSSPKL
ncbi:hypothetical protein ACCO45_008192 [Purpureocillium lilacinum]|uniref:Uncharacterized protein n=1 Tax=Purpureocillium lilacinum TaxID=33203 RepID=A0ACC4DPY0_PURLI